MAALSLGGGCADGGQSGAEDCFGDGNRELDTFATDAADEDGGVEDDGDGGPTELVSDHPEVASSPNQCPPPGEPEEGGY